MASEITELPRSLLKGQKRTCGCGEEMPWVGRLQLTIRKKAGMARRLPRRAVGGLLLEVPSPHLARALLRWAESELRQIKSPSPNSPRPFTQSWFAQASPLMWKLFFLALCWTQDLDEENSVSAPGLLVHWGRQPWEGWLWGPMACVHKEPHTTVFTAKDWGKLPNTHL